MQVLHTLHRWVVPHEVNNHRAKALHHEALFAFVLLLCVFNLGMRVLHKAAPGVLGYATDIRVEELLSSTNAKRAEEGLAPLTLNGALSEAAAAKAADMFSQNYWAHTSPSGKTPWDFIVTSGYRYTLAGENLAKNFQTSAGVVDAWMASPTHKANIVKSGYNDIGFAVVNGILNGEETTLVVQMFGATSAPAIAQIPKAQAVAPAAQVQEVQVPPPVEPVVLVPEESAGSIEQSDPIPAKPSPLPSFTRGLAYERVIDRPKVNIPTLTGNVVYIAVGLLIGLLAVDSFIISRRKVVRLVGHNIAHILFLGAMMVGALTIGRGSLL